MIVCVGVCIYIRTVSRHPPSIAASEVSVWHSPVLEEQVSLSFTSSKNGNCSELEFMVWVMYVTYITRQLAYSGHPLEFFAQPRRLNEPKNLSLLSGPKTQGNS